MHTKDDGLAVVKLVNSKNPLAHLLMGSDAFQLVEENWQRCGQKLKCGKM